MDKSTNNSEVTVYSYRRCPFAIRVRMTLNEKSVPYKVVEENLKEFSSKLLSMHPEAKVPVLVHGDTVLYESAIITEYIDEAFEGPKLMPTSANERAQVRLWTYWCNQMFKPDLDRFKYKDRCASEEEHKEGTERLHGHLTKLENRLAKNDFLVGNTFSLADIHVFPFFRQLFKVDPPHPGMAKCPGAKKWLESILAKESFTKTMAKA